MTTSDLPGDLGGTHPLASWGNRLKRAIARRTILPGLGYKLAESEGGVTLEVIPGGGGQGATITRYLLKSVQGDYLTCRTWDGTTEGTEDVYVAKVPKLRTSISSEVLDTVTFNYGYPTTVGRTARSADNSVVESQVIVPRFIVNDEIWAISAATKVTGPDGDIVRMDVNLDARAWTPAT